MKRRGFLKTAAATAAALSAQGYLPLLAGPRKGGTQGLGMQNCFTEPCAIEPLTGYLPGFSPAVGKRQAVPFSARYALVACHGADARSKNSLSGSMEMSFEKGLCRCVERRNGNPVANIVEMSVQCAGAFNTAAEWTFESRVEGRHDLGFVEKGTWDGKTMTVKSPAWAQQHPTTHPLIARWALLPLVASGRIKKAPLAFDMLDDSTLRPNQALRYEGAIDVPIKGGNVRLDSYVQTGQGIVPTHYLVDDAGCVQLITMTTVNWALTGA